MARLRRLAPYLIVGPISGPLLAGAMINFRGGRPVLASFYALALLEYAILLPMLAVHLGLQTG